jgi:hypothetical protein
MQIVNHNSSGCCCARKSSIRSKASSVLCFLSSGERESGA